MDVMCRICKVPQPVSNFYLTNGKLRFKICKPCSLSERKERYKKKQIENGGSERIGQFPNRYFDEESRKQTFQFLELIGWKFNTDNNIWYKEGIKTKDGKFINIKRKKRKMYQPVLERKRKINQQVIDQIVELREQGLSYSMIGRKLNISSVSASNHYYNEKTKQENRNG